MRLSKSVVDTLRQFVRITSPFEETFLRLQRHKYPTICDVIPYIYGLRAGLVQYYPDMPGSTDNLKDYVKDLLEVFGYIYLN